MSYSEHSLFCDKYWQYGILSSKVCCHVFLHERYAKILHGEDVFVTGNSKLQVGSPTLSVFMVKFAKVTTFRCFSFSLMFCSIIYVNILEMNCLLDIH